MPDEPKEVTAFTEPAPPDSRPEPPKGFPTMYVLTWWEWWYDSWKREWKWKSQCSMFPMDRAKSIEESAILTAKGFRSIRIVTIPGEPHHA